MDATPDPTPDTPAYDITAIPPGSSAAQSVADQLAATQLAVLSRVWCTATARSADYHPEQCGPCDQCQHDLPQDAVDELLAEPNDPTQTYSVEELVFPWRHPWGLVVRYEEPTDRPNVIDLVFDSCRRTAETRGARYRWDGDCWDLADVARDAVAELRAMADELVADSARNINGGVGMRYSAQLLRDRADQIEAERGAL